MATEIGSLVYDLTMDDKKLKKQLDASDKNVKDFGSTVSDTGEKLRSSLNKAAAGLAVVGAGLTLIAKNATDFTVDLVGQSKALGRQIGVSTEEASRLSAAVGRMGIDADKSQQVFGIFAKQIVAASSAADMSTTAFGRLGLSTKDASGKQKDFNTILFEVADKFKAMPNGIDKTAMAMELFGRSGKDMIKVLNLGSDGIKDLEKQADRLGLTLNAHTIAAVGALVKSQKDLKQQTDVLKIAIGTATAPVLTKFNETLNQVLGTLLRAPEPIRTLTAQVLAFGGPVLTASGAALGFAANISQISPAVFRATAALGALGGGVAAFGTGPFMAFTNTNKMLKDSLSQTSQSMQKLGFDTTNLKLGVDANKFSQDLLKQSTDMVAAAQRGAQTAAQNLTSANLSLQGANLNVEQAQRNYNDAVKQYGPQSLEARTANYYLQQSQDAAKKATDDAAKAVRDKAKSDAEVAKKKDLDNAVRATRDNVDQQSGAWQRLIGWIWGYNNTPVTKKVAGGGAGGGGGGGFADGVTNFRGGLALVGERGPELVNLPRGSDVIPNDKLKSLNVSGGNIYVNIGTVQDRADADYILRRIDRNTQLESLGLSPVGG